MLVRIPRWSWRLAAHFVDAIDLPTLKRHQDCIREGLADVNHRLAEYDEHHTDGRAFLPDSPRLLTDASAPTPDPATPTGG